MRRREEREEGRGEREGIGPRIVPRRTASDTIKSVEDFCSMWSCRVAGRVVVPSSSVTGGRNEHVD